jgi:L-aspartate oxidase
MSEPVEVRHVPAVVVGAGVAGLSAALELAARGSAERVRTLPAGQAGPVGAGRWDVVVIADRMPGEGGSSPWAQGGMAAAVGCDDRPAEHAADTVAAGAGLVDEAVARVVSEAAPDVVEWLDRAGARFDRRPDGTLALGREAAHGRHRIVHARDATGAELVRALAEAARLEPGLLLASRHMALELIRSGPRVVGVLTRDLNENRLVAWVAPAVVLATGGFAHLWAVTTTPPEAVGDGIVLAARAGATLADLEFVQFHPTALAGSTDPAPLLTEALRGEGAVLIDEHGDRFTCAAHPDAELAPRDVVARVIYAHLAAGHQVFLDARDAVGETFPERFPTVFRHCRRAGIDPRYEAVPVSPAAHYCMGGVVTDVSGRTSIPGLWAAGEVTATGLHGANRLASNSLLEGIVMGRRVAADVARQAKIEVPLVLEVPEGAAARSEGDPKGVVASVRQILWGGAGVVRDRRGLQQAREQLEGLQQDAQGSRPAHNAVQLARLVVDAALARRESRGAHYRRDHPTVDVRAVRQVLQPVAEPTVELEPADSRSRTRAA